jgi:hypothetical protein
MRIILYLNLGLVSAFLTSLMEIYEERGFSQEFESDEYADFL